VGDDDDEEDEIVVEVSSFLLEYCCLFEEGADERSFRITHLSR